MVFQSATLVAGRTLSGGMSACFDMNALHGLELFLQPALRAHCVCAVMPMLLRVLISPSSRSVLGAMLPARVGGLCSC